MAVWRSLDNTDEVIYALLHISQMMRFEPGYDPAKARTLLEEAWQLAQQEGMQACRAPVQLNLAVVVLEEKEYGKALRSGQHLLSESLQNADLERTTGMLWMIAIAIAGLGYPEAGLRLYAAGTALRAQLGVPDVPATIHEHHRQLLAPARRLLSAERMALLESEGQAMPLEGAVAYALTFAQ